MFKLFIKLFIFLLNDGLNKKCTGDAKEALLHFLDIFFTTLKPITHERLEKRKTDFVNVS
jgi:hypothetical protein